MVEMIQRLQETGPAKPPPNPNTERGHVGCRELLIFQLGRWRRGCAAEPEVLRWAKGEADPDRDDEGFEQGSGGFVRTIL